MSLPASPIILDLLKKTVKSTQLIVEIEGLPTFTSLKNKKYAKYGDPGVEYGDPGLVYGGLIEDTQSFAYIDLSRSTNNLTQQLLIDKGGYSSISNFDICLVDIDQFITRLITPGAIVDDVLGKKAKIYLSMEGAGHPEDSILFFSGIVSDIKAGAGFINLNISSPERLKNLEIFPKVSTETMAELNSFSAIIQGNRYVSKSSEISVTVEYAVQTYIGATPGEVEVLVTGTSILVNLRFKPNLAYPSGFEPITASMVKNKINNTLASYNLVTCKTLTGQGNLGQVAVGVTPLTSSTSVSVVDAGSFILPADGGTLTTYLKVDDEILKYTDIVDNEFVGIERAQFGTIETHHDVGASVESFYRLQGNLRDLALKLMLSGGEEYHIKDVPIISFNTYGAVVATNSIFLAVYKPEEKYGIVINDFVNIEDSINPGNNGSARILSYTTSALGSYLTLDKNLLPEGEGAKVSFKSKYNVLPKFAGLEMTPDQVDVQEFERVYNQFQSQFFEYDFFIKEQINGSEFINTQILYPSGCYALPRKAKTSLGLTIPPLAQSGTKKLSNLNIVKASNIVINRSISKNFYNSVVYKYDKDPVEDQFTRGNITHSNDSTNRIKIANKPLVIESDGIRASSNFDYLFQTQSRRFLDRYKFGAESFDAKVLFGEAFTIEIGDTVIVDGKNLNMSDTKQGNATRTFLPRLFEVQNKSMSLKGTDITLTLVDTVYSLDGRYGVIAPSSKIAAGSTTNKIRLAKSYGDKISDRIPTVKWFNYIGEKVLVRSFDWSYQEIVTISGIDPGNPFNLIVTPALTGAPSEGYILDTPKYPMTTDAADQALYKSAHCSFNRTAKVITGSTEEILYLTPSPDAVINYQSFVVGAPILVHNKDWSIKSKEVKIKELFISNVSPSYAILDKPLGFTPTTDMFIELLGYPDSGAPYRWL